MSEWIPVALVRQVRARAGDDCEYCRLPQWTQEATFHVEHVRPLATGGRTVAANLALACVTRSLRKAARSRARDPQTGVVTRLFHPRQQPWTAHFRWSPRWRVIGSTPTGRATVAALGMNRPVVIRLRQIWAELGRFPQPERE